jgi:hypothetical protein
MSFATTSDASSMFLIKKIGVDDISPVFYKKGGN